MAGRLQNADKINSFCKKRKLTDSLPDEFILGVQRIKPNLLFYIGVKGKVKHDETANDKC